MTNNVTDMFKWKREKVSKIRMLNDAIVSQARELNMYPPVFIEPPKREPKRMPWLCWPYTYKLPHDT